MLSDRALSSLRCAAAVAHAVPGVRLRVQGGGETLVQVAHRPPTDAPLAGRLEGPPDTSSRISTGTSTDGPSEPVAMGPCAFRGAVVQAHRQRQEGRRLQFMGLDAELDPAVSYGVRASTDQVLAGGMLRLLYDDRWLHLLALIGDEDEIDALVADPIDADGFEVGIAVHHDPELGVAILHVTTEVDDQPRSAAAIDALTTAAARQAIAEFEAHLSPGPATPDEPALDPAPRDRRRR